MGHPSNLSQRSPLERLRRERVFRQRAAALAGVCLVFGGVFVAVGLGLVVLVGIGLAGLCALIAWTAAHHDLSVVRRRPDAAALRRRAVAAGAAAQPAGARVLSIAVRGVRAARGTAASLWKRVRVSSPVEWPQAAAASPEPVAQEFYGWPYAGSQEEVAPAASRESRLDEDRRRALELNARGAQLRRAGSPGPAAELHLEALAIFESLDDRHAQAPTLNSLALALAAAGDVDAAVARFEESLELLRERDDEPGEGKVIANLGFTLLQQGADDRGRRLLGEALEKLPPESPAAQRVEAQLRRAS